MKYTFYIFEIKKKSTSFSERGRVTEEPCILDQQFWNQKRRTHCHAESQDNKQNYSQEKVELKFETIFAILTH
jgi:hypothetical protein